MGEKKGDVGMEKEKKKEEVEKLASFFGAVYEVFNPVPVIDIPVMLSHPLFSS